MIALFAISNTALLMLISGSRIAYGMAKEFISYNISKSYSSRKTPWVAVVIAMVSVMITVIASSGIFLVLLVLQILVYFSVCNSQYFSNMA